MSFDPTKCFTCGGFPSDPQHDLIQPGSHAFRQAVVFPMAKKKAWVKLIPVFIILGIILLSLTCGR